jgi:valyl-tRNA synthetase
MNEKFLKPYNHTDVEGRIYGEWLESGFLNPDNLPNDLTDKNGKPFTIIMPPANANGSLHAGHGLVMTIQDIMIRYKRMKGYRSLWLPGLDHAGFETQVVYEKKLEKEGRSRFEMEPKKLYEEIMAFTLENSTNIKSQIKSMGASCDWDRSKFTLDESIIKTVYSTFKKLSDDDLLYRGKKIVSWCPKHQTSFSDLEIKDEEKVEPFYYLKYGPFTIGTSRPETKFGDKYVVMHPDDKRYEAYKHGDTFEAEWINGKVKATVIKDSAIDMEFGTGVMTITPWHDAVDFDIAGRHNLDKEQVIDERGKLLPIAGEFAGLSISKARPLIIEKLRSKGLVEKVDENYKHNIKTCYKCGTTIEPQIKSQWFVRMKPLAEKALEKIKSGEIKYIPDQYEKISTHWLENIIDWNISRQIVWGIPIPAKICDKCDLGIVDLEDKEKQCKKCGGDLRKDNDTFDTWFSSGQWPYATLGYPDGKDFKDFYPTDVMETAGDIIFFWVSRMIMLGLYITGKVPFKTVYLHGVVLDAKGKKMSKSKGNVINPLDLTAKFGTDAFRMGMIVGNTPGASLSLSEDKIKGYKHFANKLWNITRFVLTSVEGEKYDKDFKDWSDLDKKMIEEFDLIIKDVTSDMDNFRFYLASEKLYHYSWHRFADVILEESKKVLKEGTVQEIKSRKQFLLHTLSKLLKTLHPFIPFVTEEIWKDMPVENKRMLIVEDWPV